MVCVSMGFGEDFWDSLVNSVTYGLFFIPIKPWGWEK